MPKQFFRARILPLYEGWREYKSWLKQLLLTLILEYSSYSPS